MKRYLIIIVLAALTLTAFAQQKKVAVYVTGQQTGINKVLGDQLVAAFAKSGKYIAIERTASFLSELSKEQNYQRTGAVTNDEIARLGEQFGVQLVCVADISEVFDEKYVSARLIDVESAEVANTSNANSKLDSMQELLSVTEKLAKELTGKTVQEKAIEIAAMQKANEETEKMLSEAFTKGYIKVDNIFAATSEVQVPWNRVSIVAAECRLGGWSDWRVPTVSELNSIYSACRSYCDDPNKSDKYPNLTAGFWKQIATFATSFIFYFHWAQNRFLCQVNAKTVEDNSDYSQRLLLVRDVK